MQEIKKLVKFFGILLILLSLFMNPITVEQLFSYDKNIEKIETIFMIMGVELILFLIGIFILVKTSWFISKRKELLLSLIVFILCFTIVEISIRILEKKPIIYSEHPYLNFYGTPNYKSLDGLNMHNSLGFRGKEIEIPKPKLTYRIALLGGSSTYTEKVKNWKKDWARQLEKELQQLYNYDKIEVINAGLPSWTSYNTLINLEFKVLELEPDLIIIYHGVNDAFVRSVNPDYYFSDNTGSRKRWEHNPCIFPFCSKIIQKLTRREKSFLDIHTDKVGGSLDPYNVILGVTNLEAYQINKPIYFERNLKSMIAIAREFNIDILLSTWTYTNQFSKEDMMSATHHQFAVKQNNEVIMKVGKNNNIWLYDFASEMPKDKIYWADGQHVNEKGSELKGKLFANFIYSNKIIEDKIRELKNVKE